MKDIMRKMSGNLRCILNISIFILIGISLLGACSPEDAKSPESGALDVVSTTTIVGDVVSQVGGDLISLTVLIPPGTDPHSFDPTPRDVATVSKAHVVFVNGGGLEAFLDGLIESAGAEDVVVPVSKGVEFLRSSEENHHPEDESDIAENRAFDPHTWTDPNNVMVWVENIRDKLIEVDPTNAAVYQANANGYLEELRSLDAWIRDQVAKIPESDRKFLVDHGLFGYYAKAYDFEQVGTLLPGYTTLAEPSAQELAGIEDAIITYGVKVILVGNTTNPSLAERVSADTGTHLVYVYTGSLSDPDDEAGTYIAYMRYNTSAIINGLK